MYKIVVSFLIVFLFAACVKKEEYDFDKLAKTSWTPQVGFPLLNSSLGVKDLMGNADSNAVTTDLNGLIVLKYQKGTEIIKASDFVKFDAGLDMDSPSIPLIPGGPYPVSIPFDTAGVGIKITRIEFESGTMQLSLESGFNQEATYDFPTLRNANDTAIRVSVPMQTGSSKSVDLSGHSIEIDATGNFTINITIPAGVSGNAKPIIKINNLEYKRIEGDFQNKILQLPKDSIQLYIFKNLAAEEELYVDDPRINVNVKNGFGVPVALDLSSMYGFNTVSGTSRTITKAGSGVFNISKGTASSPVESKIKLDKTNSNLNRVLEPTPMFIGHNLSAESNPGSSSKNVNVLEKDATIEVNTLLELPLQGRVKGLAIVDTVPFTINESFDLIRDMAISTAIKNGFPFGVKLTLSLLDENYLPVKTADGNPIFLLKERDIATSGVVNSATGRIDQNNLETKTNNYAIGNKEVKELLKGKFVRIVGVVETFKNGNEVIGIYDNYKFDLRVGVKITGNLTF